MSELELGGMSDEEKEILEDKKELDGTQMLDDQGNEIIEQDDEKPKDDETKDGDETPMKMSDLLIKKSEEEENPSAPEGVDLEALTSEFMENGGKLTEESYKTTTEAFAKVGVGSAMVDTYLIGLQAQAMQSQNIAFAAAGGEKGYAAMAKWAGDNLSDGELAAYNTATEGGPEAMKMAIESVHARYLSATGQKPTHDYSGGGNAASTKGGGGLEVASRNELQAIVGTAKYRANTPAGARYREQVHSALARSMKTGYSQLD